MAGLIPQSFIDDLMSRADIVDVVDKRVKLRKTGKNYSGLCPFHQEKTPSFSVQPDKQFYYCFGCGAGGNVVGFVMNFENVEFPRAVEILAGEYGLEVPREATSKAETQRRSENAVLLDLLEEATRFYQQQLRQHGKRQTAVDYLKTRGLSGTIARDFILGYAPPGWDNLLTALGQSVDERQRLEKAGLIIEKNRDRRLERVARVGEADEDSGDQTGSLAGKNRDDTRQESAGADVSPAGNASEQSLSDEADSPHYYDRFRDRVMFPIRDSRGRVIGFGGRVLGDDKPKYLNSPETPVFHKGRELYGLFEARQNNRKLDSILVVEGYMDVIALAQAGITNAVATLGTACSADHLRRLFRLVNEVVFCFDGDDAGRAAAWRALEASLPLLEDGREVNFLFLPEGEDPDSLVRSIGRDGFLDRLRSAVSLADYFFDRLGADLDLGRLADKARLGQLARPLLTKFPQGIYGQLMRKRLAEVIGVDEKSLGALQGDKPEAPPAPPGPGAQDIPEHVQSWQGNRSRPGGTRIRREPLTQHKSWSLQAIELILAKPEIALEVDRDLSPLADADGENSLMLLQLIELVRDDPKISTYNMLGYFYGSPVGNRLNRLMRDEKITPTEGIREEFNQIIDRMLSKIEQRSRVEKNLQALREKLARSPPADKSGDSSDKHEPEA